LLKITYLSVKSTVTEGIITGFYFYRTVMNINIGILKKFAVYGKDIESSYQE